jgi:hypothetical protein
MSLVPTYARAEDGVYYKNPVLHGSWAEHPWFICFDDDDPTELVIANVWNKFQAEEMALGILLKLGKRFSKLKIHDCSKGCKRCFPHSKWKKFVQAASFFFVFEESIPIPQEHEGVHSGGPTDCVLYSFGNPLPYVRDMR